MPSIAGSDISHVFATTMGSSDSTSSIGGACPSSPTVVSDNDPANGVFYSIASNLLGGGARYEYESTFLKNTHSTDTAHAMQLWLKGALADNTGAGKVSVQGATIALNGNYFVRWYALDNSGSSVPFNEDITCNGTTLVSGATDMKVGGAIRAMLHNSSGGALVVAPCDVYIFQGAQLLGIIPSGRWSATVEVQIGTAATKNTSATTTNPITAPSGITFYRPNTVGTAIVVPADLGPGDKIQLWWQLKVAELANPATSIQHPIAWQFT